MSNWMRDIPGGTNITKMAIPGTHDSGAYAGTNTPVTRAQDHSIEEQLKVGVRALDIRCGKTYWGNYKVFHGPIDQGVLLADVFGEIDEFLNANNSEFIILMLKQETNDGEDLSNAINDLVGEKLGARVFPRSLVWPDLVEVRGGVLVLSRLRTPDHQHFDTRQWGKNPGRQELRDVGIGTNCRLVIQDLYDKPTEKAKQEAIEDLLTEANQRNVNMNLYLNFTSYVYLSAWHQPYSVGRTWTNPWLKTNCRTGRGVICVDGVNADIAHHIIDMNEIVRDIPQVLNSDTIVGQSCTLCKTKCLAKTGVKSRWHFCKQCRSLFCGTCGSSELDTWSYFSRARKCKFCVAQTELV